MKYRQIFCFIISSFLITSQAWGSDVNVDVDAYRGEYYPKSLRIPSKFGYTKAIQQENAQTSNLFGKTAEKTGEQASHLNYRTATAAHRLILSPTNSLTPSESAEYEQNTPSASDEADNDSVLPTKHQNTISAQSIELTAFDLDDGPVPSTKHLNPQHHNTLSAQLPKHNHLQLTKDTVSARPAETGFDFANALKDLEKYVSLPKKSLEKATSSQQFAIDMEHFRQLQTAKMELLTQQLMKTEQEKTDLTKTIIILRNKTKQENKNLTQQLTRQKSSLKQKEQEKKNLAATVFSQQSQLDTQRQTMQDLQSRFDEVQADNQKKAKAEEDLTSLQSLYLQTEQGNKNLTEIIKTLQTHANQTELQAKEELQKLLLEVATLKEEKAISTQAFTTLQTKTEQEESKTKQKEEELQKLLFKVTTLKEENTKLTILRTTANQEKTNWEAALQNLQNTVSSLTEQNTIFSKTANTLAEDKINLASQLQSLQLKVITLEEEKTTVQADHQKIVLSLQSQLDTLLQEKVNSTTKATALLPDDLIRVKVANANVFAFPSLAGKYTAPQLVYVTKDVFKTINDGSHTSLIKMVKIEDK